jgi:glyoxylase-like metal-dependent hydrolase (beta-lactamase superfamily II)
MKRGRLFRRVFLSIAAVLVILAGAAIFLSQGQRSLEPGTELADGRVRVAVDNFIAAYVVELDSGDVALIDATMNMSAAAILDVIREGGKAPADVRAIFITHGHGDHIAGAKAFPDADLYVLEPDVDLVTRPLRDGDVIAVGGSQFEIFAIPGHTLGSAAFLVHGVLFLGDSAAARSDGKIEPAPPVFSTDRTQNQQSLRQLATRLKDRQSEIDWLAFGHQGPLEGLDPLLEWADQ